MHFVDVPCFTKNIFVSFQYLACCTCVYVEKYERLLVNFSVALRADIE